MEDFNDNAINEPLIIKKPLNIANLLKEQRPLDEIANEIIEGTFEDFDVFKKDSVDKFIEYVISQVRAGNPFLISLAYPTSRMKDRILEDKVIDLINIHMFPEIVFRILKHFARNVHDSDANLYLAYLINSEDIIRPIYETFLMFKKDIYKEDSKQRVLNVKRIQQFPSATGDRYASPLDAAARFKYILEFIALKQNVEQIYRKEDLLLTDKGKKQP